jgi:hypothetical protein
MPAIGVTFVEARADWSAWVLGEGGLGLRLTGFNVSTFQRAMREISKVQNWKFPVTSFTSITGLLERAA